MLGSQKALSTKCATLTHLTGQRCVQCNQNEIHMHRLEGERETERDHSVSIIAWGQVFMETGKGCSCKAPCHSPPKDHVWGADGYLPIAEFHIYLAPPACITTPLSLLFLLQISASVLHSLEHHSIKPNYPKLLYPTQNWKCRRENGAMVTKTFLVWKK